MTTAELMREARPNLAPGVRLTFDKARNSWVLLAPERVLVPDETALEILQRCDGARQLGEIVDDLASAYSADHDEIERDVRAMLAELIEKRLVTA